MTDLYSFGRNVRMPGGVPMTIEQWAADPRTVVIVRLRAKGNSYAEVGRRVGLTRERVRQILIASGNEWATGWNSNGRSDRECATCGKTFHPRGDNNNFCSVACVNEQQRTTLTERQVVTLRTITAQREGGSTWRETARALGWQNYTSLPNYLRRICKKVGLDHEPYFSDGAKRRARIFYERMQQGGLSHVG